VDDAAIVRGHRVHLDRLPMTNRVLGGHVGAAAERFALPTAIARSIDGDALAVLPPAERGLVAEQLHGVDRLSVPADQQADVLALDIGPDLLVALVNRDGGVQAEFLDDALEQRSYSLCRLFRQQLRLARLHSSFGHGRSLGARPRAWSLATPL